MATKDATVADLQKNFEESTAVLLTEYRGLTVAQLKELRNSIRQDAEYAVVKNTLTKIAAQRAAIGKAASTGRLQLSAGTSYTRRGTGLTNENNDGSYSTNVSAEQSISDWGRREAKRSGRFRTNGAGGRRAARRGPSRRPAEGGRR